MNIAELRHEYMRAGLEEKGLAADPIDQFAQWFDAAAAAGLHLPNAMTLATADAQSRPSARALLLKGFDAAGFVFFTNYSSRKGRELDVNPWVSLVFSWTPLEREVRIEGRAAKVSEAESDAYFATRPRGSQLGAWASPQSGVLRDRAMLEADYSQAQQRFGDPVPRPPYWGGYRVVADSIEFWQGRPNRLHDRIRYRRNADSSWTIERLAP